MPSDSVLSAIQRALLTSTRRAVLATIAADGRPRLVPIVFVVDREHPVIYTPIDDKPKRTGDPLALARVRDIQADPRVTILVDRWDEDWTRLEWLRGDGRAEVVQPSADHDGEHAAAVASLRAKYRQYETHRLEERPMIRITLERMTDWGALADDQSSSEPAG
jgi:PPOX class probable F420-dependent enzyme